MSRLFNRPDCDDCNELHKIKKTAPPCDTCTPPILSENKDIVDVYLQCHNQVIIAPVGGIVDIDIKAVNIAVERSRVSDPDRVFWSVIGLARERINKEKAANA